MKSGLINSSYLKQSALQLLLPLCCLLLDGFPPLVQVLQFSLQTRGLLASGGLHQIVTGFVHRLNCGFVSQHVNLENLWRESSQKE